MPAPPSTDKKQKSSRKVRPALRPSGGSGVGALVSATAVAPDGNNTATGTAPGNPTMMALLESLDKDLHGPGNTLGRPSQPLPTPSMAADGACIIGRLSDIHNPTLQSPSPAGGGSAAAAAAVAGELAPVAPSHGSTEALPAADDGSENENGGSNEAGIGNNNNNNGEGPPSSVAGSGGNADHGDVPAALPSHQEEVEPVLKDDPEFTFDPVSTAQKKGPGSNENQNGSPASGSAPTAEEKEGKEDSPSLPAKRARKNTSLDPTSPSYFKFG